MLDLVNASPKELKVIQNYLVDTGKIQVAEKLVNQMVTCLENTLTFGKYKGESVKSVAEYDAQYLVWLIQETDKVDFDRADTEFIYKKALANRITELTSTLAELRSKAKEVAKELKSLKG